MKQFLMMTVAIVMAASGGAAASAASGKWSISSYSSPHWTMKKRGRMTVYTCRNVGACGEKSEIAINPVRSRHVSEESIRSGRGNSLGLSRLRREVTRFHAFGSSLKKVVRKDHIMFTYGGNIISNANLRKKGPKPDYNVAGRIYLTGWRAVGVHSRSDTPNMAKRNLNRFLSSVSIKRVSQ